MELKDIIKDFDADDSFDFKVDSILNIVDNEEEESDGGIFVEKLNPGLSACQLLNDKYDTIRHVFDSAANATLATAVYVVSSNDNDVVDQHPFPHDITVRNEAREKRKFRVQSLV